MKLKVHDDKSGHLCYTCSHGTVVNDRYTHCSYLENVTRGVTSCSSYFSRRDRTVRDMEEIAWILKTDQNTRKIGFRPMREVRSEEEPD